MTTMSVILAVLFAGAAVTVVILGSMYQIAVRKLRGQIDDLQRQVKDRDMTIAGHLVEIGVMQTKKDELRDLNGSLEASLRAHRMFVDQIVHYGGTYFGNNSSSFRQKTLDLVRSLFPSIKVPR